MRQTKRTAAALAALGAIAFTTGCSSASDPVDPELWLQVDAAQNLVYDVIAVPSVSLPSTPEALLDQLVGSVIHWDGEDDAPTFAEDQGTSVFYNYQTARGGDVVTFDVFAASGVDEHMSAPTWLDSRPSRVYTCYRLEVSFRGGALWNFHRSHDHGQDRLACPSGLVSSLGDGAQYREPHLFDG